MLRDQLWFCSVHHTGNTNNPGQAGASSPGAAACCTCPLLHNHRESTGTCDWGPHQVLSWPPPDLKSDLVRSLNLLAEFKKAQLPVLRQILPGFVLFKAFFTRVVIAAHIVLSFEVQSHIVLVPCSVGAQLAGVGPIMAQASRGSKLVHNIWNFPFELILARLA